jgi:hypothetical protein
MAKKRQKTTRFSIQGFDLNHYRTTEQYAAAVQALFDRATLAIAQSATRRNIDPDKPFSFDDYPEVKAELKKIVGQLATQLQTTIESGSKNQWLFACDKNDGFIASIMDTSKLSKARLKKMQDRNLDALSTFQGRKVGGMDLSQRVWRYVGQYRDQLETALDVGLGEGRSAQELARDVKKNLRDPDRLFRRVRDKRGNLVLSKAARAFHPGQGVYRSSVKNAQRLTRSEINMAYRESDFLRWQQLDFVVGFEIHRSNHEPLCKCKMCDRLQGRYPKTFKFKGWHPQCMCYAVPILMDEETFDENELGDLKAALHGTEYKKKQSRNLVTDVPDGFKEWVAENMEASAGWASTPYFIKDNFVDGDLSKGLKIALPTLEPDVPDVPAIPIFKAATPQELKDYILANIAEDCTLEIKKSDLDLWNDIVNQLNQRIQQFGLPKFSRIGKPSNRQSEASWDGHDNGLNVNIPFLRNQTAIARAEKWKKRGVFYSFAYEDKEDYVRAVIDHEIGHCLMSKFSFKSEVIKTFGQAGKSVMVNGKPFNEIYDVLGYYATTCEDEYFAEAFAMFTGASRDKLGEHTKAMMEKFIEKVSAKLGRNPFDKSGKEAPTPDPVQAQLDTLMPSIEAARKIAKEWGLDIQLNALDKAVANREISKINERIATITSKANQLVSMLQKYVNDVADVTKSAKDGGVDIMKLPEFSIVTQNLIAAKADKKNWKNNFGTYQNNLESLKRAIQDELLRRKQEEEKKKSAADTETSMDDWRKRTEEAGTVTKSENDKEIETVLGIDKGVDMTFEESNDLRGNPNYAEQWLECDQKEATHSMTRDGKKVYIRKNPAYKKKYTINCQSCVVAHELRRRGFDVQAIGKTPNSIPAILSRHTELAWLDADGKTPTSTSVSWAWQSDKDAMAKSMVANLETATKAVGRYHLKWTWATGSSGHIITCERLKDGTLRIYDPQCGQIITDFATYGKRFEHGTLKILRVDNLRFNPLYAGCLKGNKAKKKKK